MKRCLKALLIFALLIGLFLGVGRLYYHFTDGFRESNIAIKLPYRPDLDIRPLTREENEELKEAIGQSYTYLDKGHQAYVFVSADRKYVLKLLKFQRVRIPNWLRKTYLPLASWEQWRLKRIAKKDLMLERLLLSWKLSFDALKDEAAIVYMHINKSDHLDKKLTLYDKMGLRHELDLDNAIFLIQRKADLLGDVLDQWMAQGKSEEAKQLLDKLLALFVSEYRRGLAEKELFILRNTGVADGAPIHIDTGRFEWDKELAKPENAERELQRKTRKLQEWLEERHPELAHHFQQRLSQPLSP